MKNIGYTFQYNGGVTPESEESKEEEAAENTYNERKAKIKELRELFKSGGI
jgi:Zn-finger nucleic acid-binding protein